jgi:hypothetical protein
MAWYKVTLPDLAKQASLQNEFMKLHLKSGGAKDAAIISDPLVRDDFYFSPGAARIGWELIARYSGTECPAPVETSRLKLVVGVDGWKQAIFR